MWGQHAMHAALVAAVGTLVSLCPEAVRAERKSQTEQDLPPIVRIERGEEAELPAAWVDAAHSCAPEPCLLELRETAGAVAHLRLTPQVPPPGAPSPGRIFALRPHERRVVRLEAEFTAEDLTGRDVLAEALGGSGRVEARFLARGASGIAARASSLDALHALAALAPRPPRRELPVQSASTFGLIDQAVAAGTLDAETAVVYKAYALFGDARLPTQFRGSDGLPADSLELNAIRVAAASLSPANQALVQPFLIPPAYAGSWASSPATGAARALDQPPPCAQPSVNWNWVESTHGWVRVWARSDLPSELGRAQWIADAAENDIWPAFAGLMTGHAPLGDGAESCNGGSAALDMYLTDLPPKYAGLCCAYHPGGAPTPTYILLDHAADADTVAHELFHAFQYSYVRLADLVDQRYDWWSEASATWSEDFIYHGGAGTGDRHLNAAAFLNEPEQPLDLVDDATNRHYGAYLLPFYVYNKTHSAAFVAASWANCATKPALEALDAALPGGFAAIWPEVALHDWNAPPVDQYFKWDTLLSQAKPADGTVVQVDIGAAREQELKLKVDLPRLSATYKSFHFSDDSIRSVAFWNGAAYDLELMDAPVVGPLWNPVAATDSARKGVKVQAIIKVVGEDPTVEDWTDRTAAYYCRDITAERIEYLTIIISNSEYADRGRHLVPPGMAPVFWASKVGCWQWKGSGTYTAVGTDMTQTDTADVTFTRAIGPIQLPKVTYLATGTVRVQVTGRCTGDTTIPLSAPIDGLETYNYTPFAAASRASYRGEGSETTPVPIQCPEGPGKVMVSPWLLVPPPVPPQSAFYVVKNDGATMIDQFSPGTGLTWHWELHAQRQ